MNSVSNKLVTRKRKKKIPKIYPLKNPFCVLSDIEGQKKSLGNGGATDAGK